MILVEEKNIIRTGKNIQIENSNQKLIEDKDFDWLLDVRRGGKFHEIDREKIKEEDIIVGNVLLEYEVEETNKKGEKINVKKFAIDEKKVKIYRGGSKHTTLASEMKKNDIIEYKYRKDELENDNGKVKLKQITE